MLSKAVGVPKGYFLKEFFAESRIPLKNSLFSKGSCWGIPYLSFWTPSNCNGYKHSRLKKLQKVSAELLLNCDASTIWNVKLRGDRLKSSQRLRLQNEKIRELVFRIRSFVSPPQVTQRPDRHPEREPDGKRRLGP
jgi:hypothetical protein